MIDVNNLHAYYGNLKILKGVSVRLEEGEIVVIIGANGAGKSALLKAIIGILSKKNGKIVFKNIDITHKKPEEIVFLGLTLIPERRELFQSLSVMENLELGAYLRRKRRKESKRQIYDSLDFVYTLFPRLKERNTQIADTLSGGEQQMLSIGRALMCKPTAILLDEPSLGLSPILIGDIFDAVKKLREDGISILLVEQNVNVALKVADRGYVMRAGKIVHEESTEKLRQNENLMELYLGG